MKIGSFELIYREGQRPTLGEGFDAFDASHVNRSDYREMYAFNEFVRQEVWRSYDLCGLLSPRFLCKTGLSAERYRHFIESNPGFDAYLFHPYPRELSLANHFLELAELEHPGISEALKDVWLGLFDRHLPTIDAQSEKYLCCHCNYFVGSKRLWSEYSVFVREFIKLLESRRGAMLCDSTPYTLTKSADSSLPMGVFVFERAFSHFLKQQGGAVKVINFACSVSDWDAPEVFSGESEFVRELLAHVDAAGAERNAAARALAVRAYYHFRRLAVLKNE